MPKCSERRIVFGGLSAFALWIFVGLPLLYGQPQQAPQIETKQPANHGVGEQGRHDPSTPSPSSQNKRGGDGDHGSEEGTEFWPPLFGYRLKITDSLLALFTFGLCIATGFLWRATLKLWKAGEKQIAIAQKSADAAKESADAAKKSSDAAIAAEQARFFVVIDSHIIGDVVNAVISNADPIMSIVGPETPPSILYRFRNYGKTPGIIKEISMGMIISTDPVDPVYSVTIRSFREHMIAAGDSTEADRFTSKHLLDISQASAIKKMEARLWYFGRIDFDDVFGAPHTHRFYFRTVIWEGSCILQSYDYKHYNQSS
jgi:hypothetical protein